MSTAEDPHNTYIYTYKYPISPPTIFSQVSLYMFQEVSTCSIEQGGVKESLRAKGKKKKKSISRSNISLL